MGGLQVKLTKINEGGGVSKKSRATRKILMLERFLKGRKWRVEKNRGGGRENRGEKEAECSSGRHPSYLSTERKFTAIGKLRDKGPRWDDACLSG